MSITVKKIALPEQQPQIGGERLKNNYMNIVGGLNVECQVRLGTLTLSIAELNQLKEGQMLKLNQKTHEPVEILLNEEVIARGELMCVDEYFAVKIMELACSV